MEGSVVSCTSDSAVNRLHNPLCTRDSVCCERGWNKCSENIYDIKVGVTVNMSKLIHIGTLQFALRI